MPRIVWEPGTIDVTADEVLATHRAKAGDGRKAKAAPIREFLRDILANGPVLQKIVVERGAAHGFSLNQLKRAREPHRRAFVQTPRREPELAVDVVPAGAYAGRR